MCIQPPALPRWISSYAGEAVDLLYRLKRDLEGTCD
jgi:hypothetical protein